VFLILAKTYSIPDFCAKYLIYDRKIVEISPKVGIVETVFITDVCTLKFKYFFKWLDGN
jgi:hypothetical protein